MSRRPTLAGLLALALMAASTGGMTWLTLAAIHRALDMAAHAGGL